jgi:hypothetical protein
MVCFGRPARIWFWNLKINKPVSEPKCARINVSVKENVNFGRARQNLVLEPQNGESSHGAEKYLKTRMNAVPKDFALKGDGVPEPPPGRPDAQISADAQIHAQISVQISAQMLRSVKMFKSVCGCVCVCMGVGVCVCCVL